MAQPLTRRALTVAVVLVAAVSAACQPQRTGTPVAGAPEASDQQPISGPVEVNRDVGPGSFDFPDTTAGLADLSSYQATLTMTFDGTEDGQPQKWSSTYVLLSSTDPAANLLTLDTSASVPEGEPVFWAEMKGAVYQGGETGGCVASVLDPASSAIAPRHPAASLIGVFGADDAGSATVNDVQVNHYTFDQRALAQPAPNKSSGELWVASEGGFLVRYVLTTSGDEAYFGQGMQGTLTRSYDLTAVNQPVEIKLPEGCPPGMVDAPQLPGASNVVNMPALLEFDTASSVLEARAFYEQELPKLGWQPPAAGLPEGLSAAEYEAMMQQAGQFGLGGSTPTPDPNDAFLRFVRGDEAMTVRITPGPLGAHVQLTLGAPPG